MIVKDFTFSYSFDNVLSQTAYGPSVDIYFPTYGLQGNHPGGLGNMYDGIKFVSASYHGTPVTAIDWNQ